MMLASCASEVAASDAVRFVETPSAAIVSENDSR
jgi:hypothetical protein